MTGVQTCALPIFAIIAGTCGKIARDVSLMMQTDVGEAFEPSGEGRGGSSTMPHKNNPVRSVLIRRAALTAGPLAGTLHTAAAVSVDERADGGWHAEWATLRDLVRRTLVAGSHAFDLVAELEVHADRMSATLGGARPGILAEQQKMAELAGHQATAVYLGDAAAQVDAVLERGRRGHRIALVRHRR